MKLSFITVCYNSEKSITQTINSYRINKIRGLTEYIIIDGSSKDNTINLIKENSDVIDIFISEPDRGIYDAMNKGLDLAKGEYVYFLNSGDTLIKNVVDLFLIKIHSSSDIIYGDLETSSRVINGKDRIRLIYDMLPHQACFYKLKSLPKFNINYSIAADYEQQLILKKRPNFDCTYLDGLVAHYDDVKCEKTFRERNIYNIKRLLEKINILNSCKDCDFYKYFYILKFFLLLIKFGIRFKS